MAYYWQVVQINDNNVYTVADGFALHIDNAYCDAADWAEKNLK